MADDSKQGFILLSIVAIVAIVGLVVLVNGNSKQAQVVPIGGMMNDAGNMGGEAYAYSCLDAIGDCVEVCHDNNDPHKCIDWCIEPACSKTR